MIKRHIYKFIINSNSRKLISESCLQNWREPYTSSTFPSLRLYFHFHCWTHSTKKKSNEQRQRSEKSTTAAASIAGSADQAPGAFSRGRFRRRRCLPRRESSRWGRSHPPRHGGASGPCFPTLQVGSSTSFPGILVPVEEHRWVEICCCASARVLHFMGFLLIGIGIWMCVCVCLFVWRFSVSAIGNWLRDRGKSQRTVAEFVWPCRYS